MTARSSRSMLTVNFLVATSLGVSFLSYVAIATLFGLTRHVDAFYAALMLPNLFVFLFVDYLGKNFLPVFASARQAGFAEASELTSSIVTIVAVFAAVVALLLVLASRPVFALLLPGFTAEEIEITVRFFLIMAPTIVLTAVTSFHEYVCQYDEDYTRVTAIRTVLPVTNLAVILAAGPVIGPYALPLAFTLGHALAFLLMARRARYRYSPRLAVREQWERKVFVNSAIVMSGGLLVRTRGLITTFLASQLGPGAVAALALAQRLVEPVQRTTFTGIRMLLFTRVARLHTESNTREIARLYTLGLSGSFLLLAPLLWWIGLHAEVIVRVLFERGAFDAEMTALVALALVGLVPSIVFFGVNALLSNAFYAMDRVLVPTLVMPVGTAVYLVAAPATYRPLGVFGLSLSLSAVAVVVFAILLGQLARHVPEFRARVVAWRLALYTLLSGAAAVAAVRLTGTGAGDAVDAVLSLVVGAGLYIGALALVKDRTLAEVYEYFRRAWPSRASVRAAR